MGLYDRDYGRQDRTPWDRVENPRSMVTILIIFTVVVFFLDIVTSGREDGRSFSRMLQWFGVHPTTLIRPWRLYETLTYGFLHDTQSILHIVFNMFVLFIFGRPVEQRIGGQEFLKVYLIAIIVGGLTAIVMPWLMMLATTGGINVSQINGVTLGASGAVVAVMVLFACYYPNQEVLFMLVIPMKAWVLAVGLVVMDLLGALGIVGTGSATAFEVHLSGAAFGYLYAKRGWSFRNIDLGFVTNLPQQLRDRSRRAKLKLHDPDKKMRREEEEADRILAKIHSSGESSLTNSERRILERYSRRQRARRDSS
ncbi:MAG: rhomboid family intramembrane serine protease [Planctomycetota bacterium]